MSILMTDYGEIKATPFVMRMLRKNGDAWLNKYAKWLFEKETYKL